MNNLTKDLNIISKHLDRSYEGLEKVSDLIDDLKDQYDLYDFSFEILEEWEDRYAKLVNKIMYIAEDFETFAFDGDSIREVEEEND